MNKKSKNALLLVVLLAIVGIAVGYAALSQELVLNGTATVKGLNDWKVHFAETSDVKGSSVTGVVSNTFALDSDKLSGTFAATLEPGAWVEYTVVVVNDGSIKAKASGDPEVESQGTYTTCTVTPISAGNELSSGSGSDEYTVRIEASEDTVAATQVQEEYTVTFDYAQVTNEGSN